jgi:hypothetical protein
MSSFVLAPIAAASVFQYAEGRGWPMGAARGILSDLRPPPQRREYFFIGGYQMESAWLVPNPLAKLSLWSDSIEIGPSLVVFRFLMRRWKCPYSELVSAQPVNVKSSFRSGVRLKSRGSEKWVVFFSTNYDIICSALSKHGVEIGPTTTLSIWGAWTGS